jgi:D-cysteine desulfhydrase
MSLHPTLLENNYSAIVTTGGIQSNHCRVVALYSQKHNLQCTLVIHGDRECFLSESGNAKLIRNTKAETVFCKPGEIASAMDSAIANYKHQGYKPYYLQGGGHTWEGSGAYIQLLKDLMSSSGFIPDYIFLPTGTGSTHAGILSGINKLKLKTKVVGISIARSKEKAEAEVGSMYAKLCKIYNITCVPEKVVVDDSFLFGGYEKSNRSLDALANASLMEFGFLMDTTYTAKAFLGMKELISRHSINGKILFWNTGGQFNYLAK